MSKTSKTPVLSAWDTLVYDPDHYNPNDLYVAGTEINLQHKALEIYLSGCKHHSCQHCHNPELWAFDVGKPYECVMDDILKKANDGKNAGILEYIWILGGEPLDQHDNRMQDFLKELRVTDLTLVLWTHYVPEKSYDPDDDRLYVPHGYLVDYVKCGPYIPGKESHIDPILGIELANPEQFVYEVPESIKPKPRDPFCKVNPLELIAYYQTHYGYENNDEDLSGDPAMEAAISQIRYGLYFGWGGHVYRIQDHSEYDAIYIEALHKREIDWFLSHEVPLQYRIPFLHGSSIGTGQFPMCELHLRGNSDPYICHMTAFTSPPTK